MKRTQKRQGLLTMTLMAASLICGCGSKTNPESDYAGLIAQSVPASQAQGPVDQYTCGSGFVIQVQGHGDTSDLHFTSGTATSFTIELIKPMATPGVDFELEASGPKGSSFNASSDPTLAGTYTFTWTPPAAGQNASGVSRVLQVSLKKNGDETQLDPKIKNCLDKSVTPVNFNLLVDGAGKAFDVSVQWPANSPVVQEGSSVPFTIVVTDETSGATAAPKLNVGPIANAGNELNADNGSSYIDCADDAHAVSQGTQWIYNCTFSVKAGAGPKQSKAHKTSQAVQGQAVVGYRVSAQSADGKQKADFNDRRTVILSQPQVGKKQ